MAAADDLASQLDMHTGRYGGSADGHGLRLALCDMARFYNLPLNLWGLSTVSRELDAQYGYEATSTALLAYLAGADEIYSIGLLGSAQILSLDILHHHHPPPLPAGAVDRIEAIVVEADKTLA